MGRYQKTERWLCPEGVYPALITDFKEGDGKYGPYTDWVLHLEGVEREDGKEPLLKMRTSCSVAENSKLGLLLIALGVGIPEDDDMEEFDANELLNVPCRVKVVHDEKADGTVWANVEKVLKAKKEKAAPAPAAAATKVSKEPAKAAVAAGGRNGKGSDPEPFSDDDNDEDDE